MNILIIYNNGSIAVVHEIINPKNTTKSFLKHSTR